MRLSFDVQDSATARQLRIQAAGNRRGDLNRAAAEGMLVPVRRSLRQMAQTNHNPFGVRSSFWTEMLAGTRADADDSGGYVATPRPVALRYFGGTVVPKTTSYLAIPARAEAYGQSPKDFSDLRFALLGGVAALVQKPLPKGHKTRGRKRDAQGRGSIAPREPGGLVFYWLVKSATINPNPDVLPTRAELQKAATAATALYFRIAARRSA